jgi:glycerophosphoryl diester phosphodiesterase
MQFLSTLAVAALTGLAAAAPAPHGDATTTRGAQAQGSPCPTVKTVTVHPYAKPTSIIKNVQVGVRPYYLVNNMTDSPLKQKLQSCSENILTPSLFSISHRGAALQFPEHTVEGRAAAARQGAGIIECDVTFTKDKQLVCRHSQCDLHTSTNILLIPELAAKCNKTFTPAANGKPATAQCCTSDITLAEFKSLCGKQDGFFPNATTPQEYVRGTPPWRTELYDTCGTVTSHAEYIREVDALGLDFTPEAKEPSVKMPFVGTGGSNYTQDAYIRQLIGEYQAAGIHPSRVWFQSFVLRDVLQLVEEFPEFAKQAMYLDERTDTPAGLSAAVAGMQDLANKGVKIIAPAIPWLLSVDPATKKIVPSDYAKAAQKAGLKIVTWSLERSGPLANVGKLKDYYYETLWDVIRSDGQMMEVVDVLAQQVKVLGIFSDWPATVTYYANCLGLKGGFLDRDRN